VLRPKTVLSSVIVSKVVEIERNEMNLTLLEGLPGGTSDVDPWSSGSGWLLDGDSSGGEDCLTLTSGLRTLYIQDWAISRQRVKRRDIEEKILSSIFVINPDVYNSRCSGVSPGHEDKVRSIIKLRQPEVRTRSHLHACRVHEVRTHISLASAVT
jgi:hypothetical protein